MNKEKEAAKLIEQVKSRSEELIIKLIAGDITLEESKELIQQAIVLAVESAQQVRNLQEVLAHKENELDVVGSAAAIYRDFITSEDLNDDFETYFGSILDEMYEETEGSTGNEVEEDATGNEL
ncbi:hypothetical protein [Neobacillus jeddahensis]|uniref:hypothetical protein n=1 Tax=Neobacillus jeddahensis TaxID=1461580 RepID=UPI0005A84F87|nr:hypothetical protein [Neobacillus jeddahensis]